MGWVSDNDGEVMVGKTDEHNDSNVLDWFMGNIHEADSISNMDFIRIDSCWRLFNHFDFKDREVFCHDMGGV